MNLVDVEVYQNAARDQPRAHANYLDVVLNRQLAEVATVTCMGGVVTSPLSNIVSTVNLHP
jgi:hypothetical protein